MSTISQMRDADPERYEREYLNGTNEQISRWLNEAFTRFAPAKLKFMRAPK